uniref:Uncharacterized protein n=1 Tax=Davidia involucrata TaxID=16924 RepID=A0A5B6ZR38_DAVIN
MIFFSQNFFGVQVHDMLHRCILLSTEPRNHHVRVHPSSTHYSPPFQTPLSQTPPSVISQLPQTYQTKVPNTHLKRSTFPVSASAIPSSTETLVPNSKQPAIPFKDT